MSVDQLPFYREQDRQAQEAVRAAIGDERFEAAFAKGAGCSLEEALTMATSIGKPKGDHSVPSSGGRGEGPLTKREWQVAEQVAEGLSNKDIASRLLISKRTVDGHVERILGKLGVRSRVQVASWVAEQRIARGDAHPAPDVRHSAEAPEDGRPKTPGRDT